MESVMTGSKKTVSLSSAKQLYNVEDTSNPYDMFDDNRGIDENGQTQLFNPAQKKLFRVKGAFLTGYDFIQHFKGSDKSTILHENAHWYLDTLIKSAKHKEESAVFGKCDNLQDQINLLKLNQEKEFEAIEQIEQRNSKNIMQKKEQHSQVQEYLRLAEKSASRVPKSIQEQRQRYKNVTFEILETATGYKRQFIANPKNW